MIKNEEFQHEALAIIRDIQDRAATRHILHDITGQQGQPVEDAFPGARLPAFLTGAKLYEVDGRKVIARPDRRSRR